MTPGFFTSAGILAPLVLFWQNIQGFIGRFLHIFWKVREVPSLIGVQTYLEILNHSRIIRFDNWVYQSYTCYSKKLGHNRVNLFKLPVLELCFYKGFMPVLMTRSDGLDLRLQYLKFTFPFERLCKKIALRVSKELRDNCLASKDVHGPGFYISFIHGKGLKSVEEKSGNSTDPHSGSAPGIAGSGKGGSPFCTVGTAVHYKLKNRCVDWDVDDLLNDSPESNTDKYQMTADGKLVLQQVQRWYKAGSWYEQKGIAWRRGIALNGAPGNGKSSLVKKVAQRMCLPLNVFDLSSLDNGEFEQALSNLKNQVGIYLFEDLDAVFDGRENITKTSQFGGLTFDCFINKLGGVESMNGKFIFITTNHLDKLDPAIKRPGRIDDVICIQPLNTEEKLAMATVMLDQRSDLIDEVMRQGQDDTTAEFENRCSKLALDSFWGPSIRT